MMTSSAASLSRLMNMKDKKAQGMSINIIVVAAVALLVMIILIAIFGQKMLNFSNEQDSCEARGGTCQSEATCDWPSVKINAECSDATPVCCINLNKDDNQESDG